MSKRPSKYKRKTDRGIENKDVNDLINALKAVKIGQQAVRAAATAFKIPRTSLKRYITTFEKTGKIWLK